MALPSNMGSRVYLALALFLAAADRGGNAASLAPKSQLGSLLPLSSPLSLSLDDDLSLLSRQISVSQSKNSTRHLSTTATTTTSKLSHVRRRQQQQQERRKKDAREKATVLKAFYYFIQALGNSDRNGCKQPQPSFTATCPEGAFIVSQSSKSEWTSRLDCNQTDASSIHCVPKEITAETQIDIDLEDQNGVVMACYASDEDLLQVSVQVHAGSYFCDKALEVKTVPHPTVIAGGNVYQTVAIQKQCWTEDGDAESWIFVEPACGSSVGPDTATTTTLAREQTIATNEDGMLQHTEVPIQTGGGVLVEREYINLPTAIIAHCQMQDNCTAELECSPRCAGKSSCQVDLPGFVTTSTPATTTANPPEPCSARDVAMNLRDGQACEFNLMCSSGVCIHGECESVQKEDHETCEEGSDCISQACGKHPATDTSSIESIDIPDTTCCPSGGTFGHEGESFCSASQPVGAACHEDAMCESDICVFNTCRPKLLDDGVACEESNDCLGGHCGHYHDLDVKICCATGDSILLGEGPMCSNRPPGDVCENTANSLCQGNICVEGVCQGIEQEIGEMCDNHFDCFNDACALASVDPSAPYICCPTGEYVFLSTIDEISSSKTRAFDAFPISGLRVCTGQPLGASCGEREDVDDICTSGLCIKGTCHEARQPAGATCANDSDCENLVCALSSLEEDATTICCPSNDHKHIYTDQLMDVCTGQPVGAQCGQHNVDVLCESGSCVEGICHEHKR